MTHPPLPSQSDQGSNRPAAPGDETVSAKLEFQVTDRATGFLCPVCIEENLTVAEIIGTQVCACESCGGFVVDSESFGLLVQSMRKNYRGPDARPTPMDQSHLNQQRHCPACFETMNTHPYYGPGNAVIDSCPHCRLTWLDQNELTRIERAPGRR